MESKTFFIKSILFIFIGLTLANCSDESIGDEQYLQTDLKSHLKVLESTSNVSSLFFNAGGTSLEVSGDQKSTNSTITFKTNSQKSVIINGFEVELNKFDVLLENDFLILKDRKEYQMTLIDGEVYVKTPNYNGFLKNASDSAYDTGIAVLYLYLNELTTEANHKFNGLEKTQNQLQQKACSFWNTYYVYNFGISSATASAATASEASTFIGGGICSAIGGIDTSCVGGSHGCLSTQAMCCSQRPRANVF